jgi:hypothetical protein
MVRQARALALGSSAMPVAPAATVRRAATAGEIQILAPAQALYISSLAGASAEDAVVTARS